MTEKVCKDRLPVSALPEVGHAPTMDTHKGQRVRLLGATHPAEKTIGTPLTRLEIDLCLHPAYHTSFA
jgi:hypothetical protein